MYFLHIEEKRVQKKNKKIEMVFEVDLLS